MVSCFRTWIGFGSLTASEEFSLLIIEIFFGPFCATGFFNFGSVPVLPWELVFEPISSLVALVPTVLVAAPLDVEVGAVEPVGGVEIVEVGGVDDTGCCVELVVVELDDGCREGFGRF